MNDITKTNIPRFVEHTNARLEIRRDESQANNRRKKDRDGDHPASFEWDEMASVSVMSLYAFLGTLIESRLSPENSPPIQTEHMPKTSLQKQAIGAYHRNQHYVAPPSSPPPIVAAPTPPDDGSVILGDDFNETDIARIHAYRQDLMELNRRGVSDIQLERSATFLDAIGDAIAKAKG
jgi:hypothetical protein